MQSDEIREKYLDFFTKQGHKQITPSPLVLEGDPTTLFTSSGMQQLVPYLKGEKHPLGQRLVDCQPSVRAQGKNDDLEEVGDPRHLTYFEMLGNWGLGDYFKAQQLPWVWEFFTQVLKLLPKKLYVSVFAGTKEVPRDDESITIWKQLGVPDNHLHLYPAQKNWWSRSGTPEEMPPGEIGGPDSEVFFEFDKVKHDPKFGPVCHPNCDCGRFVEIGNSVFIQYEKLANGSLQELPQKNVDFGGGLERLCMAVNNCPDMFMIDLFAPVVKALERETGLKYSAKSAKAKSFRVIADHLRASVMLINEGVVPANKMQGYVLRKLLRRAIFHLKLLGVGLSGGALAHIAEGYKSQLPQTKADWDTINQTISQEGVKFGDALEKGLRKLTRIIQSGIEVNGKIAFDLYQTDGFPMELTLDILKHNGIEFSRVVRTEFAQEMARHQALSRSASAGMFKGGLADGSEEVTKLHTATHLLHATLRTVLGKEVSQKGSNITAERLRFDFSYPQKLTAKEIKQVEALVNHQIKANLAVVFQEMPLDQAIKAGALHFFAEKYGEKVKVYTIGPSAGSGSPFSREVCGGPHVKSTGEIGHVRIIKQEKLGTNIIRIYATTYPAA